MKYRNKPTIACHYVVQGALHRTIWNEGQHVWSVLQKSCSFFCWQCLLEDFSLPRPVHHRPSHQWMNHSKTYHPYPEWMYSLVAAFYPHFSRLKFRHSFSFADSCTCTDALCRREKIHSSVRVLITCWSHQQALIFLQLADGSDGPSKCSSTSTIQSLGVLHGELRRARTIAPPPRAPCHGGQSI